MIRWRAQQLLPWVDTTVSIVHAWGNVFLVCISRLYFHAYIRNFQLVVKNFLRWWRSTWKSEIVRKIDLIILTSELFLYILWSGPLRQSYVLPPHTHTPKRNSSITEFELRRNSNELNSQDVMIHFIFIKYWGFWGVLHFFIFCSSWQVLSHYGWSLLWVQRKWRKHSRSLRVEWRKTVLKTFWIHIPQKSDLPMPQSSLPLLDDWTQFIITRVSTKGTVDPKTSRERKGEWDSLCT